MNSIKPYNNIWLIVLIFVAACGALFYDAIQEMVKVWNGYEEYSYGFLIPFLSLFIVWQKWNPEDRLPIVNSWGGFLVVLAGLSLYLLGLLSTIYTFQQYALIVVILGAVWSLFGWRGVKEYWVPIFFLFFMIPLPAFIFQSLSASLQLMSSVLGVAILKLLGISVYLEGNVIDLGTYQLQVAEACNGLRYLFPLTCLAFIAAYFYKDKLWKKIIIVLSSAPIAVIMNSFRIAMIGILVDHWGIAMAEGFIHDFEGWVVFMACLALLMLEMWILSKLGREKKSLADAFVIDLPTLSSARHLLRRAAAPMSGMASAAAVVGVLLLAYGIGQRVEIVPERTNFSNFPMQLSEWTGKTESMEQIYLDVLQLDDYIISDYRDAHDKSKWVNLYMAFYGSQKSGVSAHSPRACIPGGGWEIKDIKELKLDPITIAGTPLVVNRTIVQKGESGQLVYYWFQQRGRVLTSEYLVKWYILWDSIFKNRSDGALVRLIAPIDKLKGVEHADSVLRDFLKAAAPTLPQYVPG